MKFIGGNNLKKNLLLDITCQLWSQHGSICFLHDSRSFGNAVNIFSAILSLIAVILEFVILFFVNDLDLYGRESVWRRTVEIHPLPGSGVVTIGQNGIFIHFPLEK